MRKLLLLLLMSVLPTIGVAAERYALVIGNSDYDVKPLANPLNDATDMANQLQQLGYKVYGGGPALDLDRVGMERALRAFTQSLPEEAHALVYYAGHGMATDNDNFLIPVRHDLEFQEQLPDRTVGLRSIVDLLKNANPDGINVVLLDACRDNPLTRSFRSTRQGLNRLSDIPRGVFIGYAADSGQVAEDGNGRNGTYTEELLKVMQETPNVIIEIAHKDVADRVYEKTSGKQFPVSENKVYGNWCFGACGKSPNTLPSLSQSDTSQPVKDNRKWLKVGGVVLALIVVGAAAQSGGDDSGESNGNYTLVLNPPE